MSDTPLCGALHSVSAIHDPWLGVRLKLALAQSPRFGQAAAFCRDPKRKYRRDRRRCKMRNNFCLFCFLECCFAFLIGQSDTPLHAYWRIIARHRILGSRHLSRSCRLYSLRCTFGPCALIPSALVQRPGTRSPTLITASLLLLVPVPNRCLRCVGGPVLCCPLRSQCLRPSLSPLEPARK